jgi:hypothetical protein
MTFHLQEGSRMATVSDTEQPSFNSAPAVAIAENALDGWATDHHEAAKALQVLVKDLITKKQLIGDKEFARIIKWRLVV